MRSLKNTLIRVVLGLAVFGWCIQDSECLPRHPYEWLRKARKGELTATVSQDDLFYNQQLQDHFDASNTQTWSQRYFVNWTYFDEGNRAGPVFLCVGGEGPPLDSSVVRDESVHCSDAVELAQQTHALLLAVEHRYYGVSLPAISDFSTSNLRFLSAQQALADLVQFHAWFVLQNNLTLPSNVWVSWGGSYPGMLAGWLRLQFPNTVAAAVSSSAPVKAQLDFVGYNDVVASALANPVIGGSSACQSVVSEGHAMIADLLTSSAGHSKLASLFNLCDNGQALNDVDNQIDWAGNGVISIPAQENDPSCTSTTCNIAKICDIMLNATLAPTPLDGLAAVAKLQRGGRVVADYDEEDENANCMTLDHQAYIDSLLDVSLRGGVGRIWFYQTCSEFAFYQTCNTNSQCPYTRGLNTVDKQLELCEVAFQISADQVQRAVDFSNAYWGADRPAGSRIMYPNGDVDPWHALSVLTQVSEEEPILMVSGASHHFWTHPTLPTDSSSVVEARQTIWNTVTKWIEEATLERMAAQQQQ